MEYGIQASTCRRQNNHGRVYIHEQQQQITRTHTRTPGQAITHTHASKPPQHQCSSSRSLALVLSQLLLRSTRGNNNKTWPTLGRSRCLCRRRCQRRKQGGVRHRRTLIKHSQLSESPHTHTWTARQDGWRRKKRARVRARAPRARASEMARCGRVKCDECAIILLYVCRERAALLFFQLRFLT